MEVDMIHHRTPSDHDQPPWQRGDGKKPRTQSAYDNRIHGQCEDGDDDVVEAGDGHKGKPARGHKAPDKVSGANGHPSAGCHPPSCRDLLVGPGVDGAVANAGGRDNDEGEEDHHERQVHPKEWADQADHILGEGRDAICAVVRPWHAALCRNMYELLILARIDFWCSADSKGKVRSRVIDDQGYHSVAFTYENLGKQVGLSGRQARYAVATLVDRGLLAKSRHWHMGKSKLYLRPCPQGIQAALEELDGGVVEEGEDDDEEA
jgi:hypothetical protein